jgi:hypothetical protein
VAGAYVVEVIVQQVVAAYVAFVVDHGVGVLLTIFPDVFAAVAEVGVEHAFKLNAHDVAPLGLSGEV